MILFLFGIALLIAGYYVYGALVEKLLGPDDRQVPARAKFDAVDFVELPHWKNMLIQLLNIAGVGPVIGVILGIKFGSIVFLIIPFGNVLGGAVHDFLAGMMSIRGGGCNLPTIVRRELGQFLYSAFLIFVIVLLLLVVTVFINVPASLIDGFAPEYPIFWWAVAAIFVYYLVATLFPVDQIIGRVYPLFGLLLLIGTGAIFLALLWHGNNDPYFLAETQAFKNGMLHEPIIPCLFVTIACGIMSGFHATQSPIVARTLQSERQARSTFYGMMIVEGIIAMIWAAAGLAIYNLRPELLHTKPMAVLNTITNYFLGSSFGTITVIAVIILAVTSGDTALRCCRLTVAERFEFPQIKLSSRLMICIPLSGLVVALLAWSNANEKTFDILWRYFAWGNQILAVMTLLAGIVWLYRNRKPVYIALIPGTFMLFIVTTFILWTSTARKGPAGFGLSLELSYLIAGITTAILIVAVFAAAVKRRKLDEQEKLIRDECELEAGRCTDHDSQAG